MKTNDIAHLTQWTHPRNYIGETWEGYYIFLGQNRDSGARVRSNFECGLKAIGGETDTCHVVRESHWAVGWIEWIAIHESDTDTLQAANDLAKALADYPVVDEEHWSETEQAEAEEIWTNCYDASERIEYIRQHRGEFEFNDMADMIGCVRGEYFAGYASSLLN